MKKVIIAASLVLATASASAVEVGVNGLYDWSGTQTQGGGFSISQGYDTPVGGLKAAFEYARINGVSNHINQYSLVATKELFKLPLNASVGVRGGAAYVEPVGDNHVGGAAGILGVSVSAPLTKTVSVEVGLDRRFVENKTGLADGNVGFLGLRLAY